MASRLESKRDAVSRSESKRDAVSKSGRMTEKKQGAMFELLDGILNVIGWMLNHIMGTVLIGLGVVFLYLAVVAGGGFWLVAAGLVLIGLGIYFWL